MSKTMFFFAATLFGGLLQAQTLNLLQGNGQLQPDFEYQGGTPIVFKVTASTDSNTPGLPGQVITITATPYGSTKPVVPPLTATTLVTGADGTVAVNFLPPVIGYGSNVSYNQYEFTASLATQGTLPYIFFETGYATDTPSDPTTPQAAAQLVSPTNLRSVTYTGQAGISGTPVQISVFVAAGPQSGQSIGDVTITPVLIPPFGTGATVQSVRCKEAYSLDYEGSVYTTFVANSIATCTPIFTLPNAVFPPGTNNFQFEILVGDNFVYGPITYNITVAPVTLSGGLINAEAPYPATQLVVTGGSAPYTFTIVAGALPAGVTLNAQTGIVSGTPTAPPGVYDYTVKVVDATGTTASLAQSIAVSTGIVGTATPILSAYVGEKVSSTVTLTGGVPPLTIKTVTGLPGGFTDQIQAGGSVVISGTAAALAAPVAISIAGTDFAGIPFSVPVDFQVVPDLTVAGENPVTALVGVAISPITVAPANGVAPYTFAVTGLPNGLSLSVAGMITGTVTATTPGTYKATITVTDSLGETQTISPVFYVESSALAIAPASVPAAFAGLPYKATLQFTGGVPAAGATPYTVALGTGSPAGVTLVNGVLAGIFPTAGTANIPIVVTDGTGASTPLLIALMVQNVAFVNAGSFLSSAAIAPGEIVSIFGSGLGPTAGVSGSTDPATGNLATTLDGLQVLFGNTPAPIFFENATQVNVQVPYELVAGKSVPVVISINNTPYTVNAALPIGQADPGIFAIFPADYTLASPVQAVALNSVGNSALTLNTTTNPVPRGQYIVLYATGGGTLSAPITDGELAGTSPLINITDGVGVTIGGQAATVSFAGLAPGFIGLIQVNALVPESVTPGSAVPVVLSFGGADNHLENTVIAVQ